MCGEKEYALNISDYTVGSPPHVRGKAVQMQFELHILGITPACAGKSSIYRNLC